MFSKVAVFLALFAIVKAQGFGSIVVDTQDGDTVVINKNTGQKVRIDTNPVWGEGHTIKVQVAGPAVPPKAVHIPDHTVDPTGAKQSDILNQVLEAFNGDQGEGTYQQLLKTVAQQVATGKVHPIVLDALETACNDQQIALVGAQKLIQKIIQKQGTFGGLWEQDSISSMVGLKGSKDEYLKKALICQTLGECGPLAGIEAEEALGVAGPKSHFAKQALLGKMLGGYGGFGRSGLDEEDLDISAELARESRFGDVASPFAGAYATRGFGKAGRMSPFSHRSLGDVYGRGLGARGSRGRLSQVLGMSGIQKEAFGEY